MRLTIDGSEQSILQELHKLRDHSYAPRSNFNVAAILRVALPSGQKIFYGGVNVELPGPSTSAMHAEQTALSSAMSDLGPDIILDSVWVMGGTADATSKNNHPAGMKHIEPCGHCRQLLSYRPENAQASVFSVAINDKEITAPSKTLGQLYPSSFNQTDLAQKSPRNGEPNSKNGRLNTAKKWQNVEPRAYIQNVNGYLSDEAYTLLQNAAPLEIDIKHEYTPITACLVKLENQNIYGLGVLIQDAGFQTTPALAATIAPLIARFGIEKLKIEKLYLYSPTEQAPRLSSDDIATIQLISSQPKLEVNLYYKKGKSRCSELRTLVECGAESKTHELEERQSTTLRKPMPTKR